MDRMWFCAIRHQLFRVLLHLIACPGVHTSFLRAAYLVLTRFQVFLNSCRIRLRIHSSVFFIHFSYFANLRNSLPPPLKLLIQHIFYPWDTVLRNLVHSQDAS